MYLPTYQFKGYKSFQLFIRLSIGLFKYIDNRSSLKNIIIKLTGVHVVVVLVTVIPGVSKPMVPVVGMFVVFVPVAMDGGAVLADQTPDGEHRLCRSACAAAPPAVAAVIRVTSSAAAGTGSRTQIHDYGGAMVTGFRSDHGDTDDIYRERQMKNEPVGLVVVVISSPSSAFRVGIECTRVV